MVERRRRAEPVESRVRRVVAAHLAVDPAELSPGVSLTDDLAADSLDLVELEFAFEDELGIRVPESTLEEVRTYADLVHAVQGVERRQRAAEARAADTPADTPAFVWARLVPAPESGRADVRRAGWLTPYTAEVITEEVLRAGQGARLELLVSPRVSQAAVAQLGAQFHWLARRGIGVSVRREAEGRRPDAA
jgi:acyl carrier protein